MAANSQPHADTGAPPSPETITQEAPTMRQRITVTNPVTGEAIGSVEKSPPQQVELAVQRARAAHPDWAGQSVKARAKRIRAWADTLWQRKADAIRIIRQETGKVESGALQEIIAIDSVATYYTHHAARILKPKRRRPIFPLIHRARLHYKPHGVVGIIAPWNYPLMLPFMDMIPALIAGNTVVLKPSDITPLIAQFGVELMHEVGMPADVVQIVNGDGETGAALVEHVDYIAFTGSTATGRKVAMRAAERLIPYSMELGGKDPAIVLADADLDRTAAELLRSAYENAGQACLSIERAYVVDAIYDDLLQRLQHYVQKLVIGHEEGLQTHMGSLTNARELQRTEAHVADAVARGATVLIGGNRRPDLGPLFYEPTILVNVNHTMDVMREETFGPLLPIMRVRDEAEALRLANDTAYGLSASVFSQDLKHAAHVASQINSGDVNINRSQIAIGAPDLPTGGQRTSGVGRRNGPEGLLKYVSSQVILTDTLIAQGPMLSLLEPLPLRAVLLLRAIRRHVPFI